MRTCSPADAMRTSLQWWPSPELTFSSRNWAVFPGVLVLGSVSGKRCPPGSTSHHGARYCSQEVPATSGTARRVTTQPRWLLHWVITAAQRCNARLHDSPAVLWEATSRLPRQRPSPSGSFHLHQRAGPASAQQPWCCWETCCYPAGPICHFVPALQEVLRDGNWKWQGPTPGELELGALCHFCPYKMASWQSWASSPGIAVPVSGAPDSPRRALFVSSLLVSQGTVWSL